MRTAAPPRLSQNRRALCASALDCALLLVAAAGRLERRADCLSGQLAGAAGGGGSPGAKCHFAGRSWQPVVGIAACPQHSGSQRPALPSRLALLLLRLGWSQKSAKTMHAVRRLHCIAQPKSSSGNTAACCCCRASWWARQPRPPPRGSRPQAWEGPWTGCGLRSTRHVPAGPSSWIWPALQLHCSCESTC